MAHESDFRLDSRVCLNTLRPTRSVNESKVDQDSMDGKDLTEGRPDERAQTRAHLPGCMKHGSVIPNGERVCGIEEPARRRLIRRSRTRRRLLRVAAFVTVLIAIAAIFVGWEVTRRRFFPDLPTGVHHFLLTVLAMLVTSGISLVVYLAIRRQHRRLSVVAEQLARVLESYMADPNSTARFENPHLVQCSGLLGCDDEACPMHDLERSGDRCWQVLALKRGDQDFASTSIAIGKCHECEVYRLSCPDKLTELGESFNNLLFLLGQESRRLERLRSQMVEKEKMVSIGQLASGIAHEVANPLSSISSVVQVLKRKGTTDVHINEQFDLIETHIQRITGIVRKLSTLARPVVEQWGPVDVGAALREAVRLISFDRRAKNVDIRLDTARDLPSTHGIPGEIEQVFINLSLNAFDAMHGDGRLTIRARHEDGQIVVRIADTGTGIPPETGRRVFEPFFTTKDPGRGTGLGLSVSYGIVQKHGGEIDLESTVNEGTTFTVRLPVRNRMPDRKHVERHHTSR